MVDPLYVAALVEFEAGREHGPPDRPPLGVFGSGGQSRGNGQRELFADDLGAFDQREALVVEADIGTQRQLRQQVVHVLEVVAHGVCGQTEFGGDIGESQCGEVVAFDQADGGVEDLGASLRLPVRSCHGPMIPFLSVLLRDRAPEALFFSDYGK